MNKTEDTVGHSNSDEELAQIFQHPSPHDRHKLLQKFTRDHPGHGGAFIYLGQSYLMNRFSPDLDLPSNILVFGGPVSATPDTVKERLEKAEECFRKAAAANPGLADDCGVNLALTRIASNRFGTAVAYIEEQLRKEDHTQREMLRSYLGIAYRELGEYDLALDIFRSLVGGNFRYIHRHIALTLMWKDDLEAAIRELREDMRSKTAEENEILSMFLVGMEAEKAGEMDVAADQYGMVASICRFNEFYHLVGINASRRCAKLTGNMDWSISDYCNQLSY
jgi:tetratricopeptide (TPR) repeat protein